MNKPLLIVGLDPGTTAAVAILDLDGKIISTHAAKNKDRGYFISHAIQFGIPVITATDVNPAPHFVHEFHRKMGTQLMVPQEDLLVKEKKEITAGLHFETVHEQDAAAAALHAHKKIKPVLDRIDEFLKRKGKTELNYDVKKLVLSHRISPQAALTLIQEPMLEPAFVQSAPQSERTRSRLITRLLLYKEKMEMLQRHNQQMHEELQRVKNRKDVQLTDRRAQHMLCFKEQRIIMLQKVVAELQRLLAFEKQQRKELYSLFDDERVVLKKLRNLSTAEVERVGRVMPLNGVILVDDARIVSERAVRLLACVRLAVCRKMPDASHFSFLFPLVPAEGLRIVEGNAIAHVSREELERACEQVKVMLHKIVDEYRAERAF